jgi:hypothetical protein
MSGHRQAGSSTALPPFHADSPNANHFALAQATTKLIERVASAGR